MLVYQRVFSSNGFFPLIFSRQKMDKSWESPSPRMPVIARVMYMSRLIWVRSNSHPKINHSEIQPPKLVACPRFSKRKLHRNIHRCIQRPREDSSLHNPCLSSMCSPDGPTARKDDASSRWQLGPWLRKGYC